MSASLLGADIDTVDKILSANETKMRNENQPEVRKAYNSQKGNSPFYRRLYTTKQPRD